MTEIRRDFAPGVLTGADVKDLFALAKVEQFALPAANCTGSNTINGVLETAARLNSPVIIQFSHSGAAFIAGKGVGAGGGDRASILGAIAGARHVNTLAEAYGARVILHTDHCAKGKLGWVDGLLDAGEEYFAATVGHCSRRTCSTCRKSRWRRTSPRRRSTSSGWRPWA